MITVLTSCIGRELYLSRLINSVNALCKDDDFEWNIYFQGHKYSERMESLLQHRNIKYSFTEGIATSLTLIQKVAAETKREYVLKLDDDALICTPNFFNRYVELAKLIPESIIYPFEVDGYTIIKQENDTRQVIYAPKSNIYYTISNALLPSGLASLYPVSFLRKYRLPHFQKDAEMYWTAAKANKFPVYQVNSGLVVEHQEGRSGQYYRAQNPKGQSW